MKLIFATNNPKKVEEIRSILPDRFTVLPLKEAGLDIDIPEPHPTLEGNAEEKADVIYQLKAQNTFSEDTGLEVYALNNEPGVRSARYAGENCSFDDNIRKLLSNLKGINDRRARFRTVICLIFQGKKYFFEGICEGKILEAPQGKEGFGYDPIFVPDGADRSFGEMNLKEKNRFSHRKKATGQLVNFLNQQS